MDQMKSAFDVAGAFDALDEGFAAFDSEDRMILCNAQFRDMLPECASWLKPGLAWQVFKTEAQRDGFGRALDRLETHILGHFETEMTIEEKLGDDRVFRLKIRPLEAGAFALVLDDITEQRGADSARVEALTELTRFIDASPINLLVYDLDRDRFVQCTPAWEDLFGVPETVQDIWVDLADRADYLAELLARDRVDNFEAKFRGRSGRIFPGRVSARMIEHDGSRVTLSSTTDMTAFYAQRDELAKQREAAYQTEKLTALGELLAGVAHELNNPLSVVVGQALMLREDTRDPESVRRIEKISTSADRCSKIVKTFLAMARQKPSRLVPTSLNDTIRLALDVGAYGLRSAGIPVEANLKDNLPPVLADEDQITQVFVNLLLNAQQALEAHGDVAQVHIDSWYDARNDTVCASVSDTGPGVPQALQARIFEPFFTTKGIGKGTGIGLALCHRVARSHNGRLDYEPVAGTGARFVLSLPASQETVSPQTYASKAMPSPASVALVIDDEYDVAEMIADILRTDGVQSTLVQSAEDALAILEGGSKFDVVFSDLKMPGLGGRGFLKALQGRFPELVSRTAFVTGDAMGGQADAQGHILGRPVLEKPISPRELRSLVRDLTG